MTPTPERPDPGADLFARFAYAPNDLGYCGPPDATALASGSPERIRAAAHRFTGAWPYLAVMAEMTGIADPLDERLVRAYWLGGGMGADLDGARFLDGLLARIGPVAGPYWHHLTADLTPEAAPNHAFHVFAVYPWSRLLGRGPQPLHVLDSCRITWGTVLTRTDCEVEVSAQQLLWDGRSLYLSEPRPTRAVLDPIPPTLATHAEPGDRVAIHWGRVCAHLDHAQVENLAAATTRQLAATNRRLTDTSGPAR
ncbi:DUF6390 family protein [Nocardia bovistercoris]|uniref:Uncharacterized protein n=1 Tax=Nocardia bovistercoris TaxID=2785916 RepID=A0A931IFZ2_9NOCA|nr:DUF6390 family protein [Nocardia bovistercoris]MBH0780834.1 hypothetical protein [Nocardia bovistercoris]